MGGFLAIILGLTDGRAELEPAQPYPGVSSAVRAVVDLFGVPPPYGYISARAPPILLIHGTADVKVPHSHSVDLAAALLARGVKHRLVLVPDAPHGFNLTPGPDNPSCWNSCAKISRRVRMCSLILPARFKCPARRYEPTPTFGGLRR
jgi:acetyl esterase/lipase